MIRAAVMLVASVLIVCALNVPGVPGTILAQQDEPSAAPLPNLSIIAPAAPGGGWDQLAREMQREIERQQLASAVQVENIPGAAGTIGLAQLINTNRGDGQRLLVNGLVMLGAILWNQSPVPMAQATPIARLTAEYEIVAVPAASPHRDMQSLVRALRENPAGLSWGGGSAGGTDHMLAGLIVAAAGVDPRRTNYIAFSGGGEAATALLGGQVTAGISGYSEFGQHIASGRLRAIAVSSAERLADLNVPTLREQGLDVELANWRAVMAPPGLDESQTRALTAVVDRMAHSDGWRATLARLGWTDAYLAGPAFEEFLDDERVRIGRIVARLRGSGAEADEASRSGEWVFPGLVLGGCALIALLLATRREGRRGEGAGDARPAIRVATGLVAFIALLNFTGFVVAGTVLFVCATSAFGSRRWPRDAVAGIVFCGLVYLAFTRGLGITLP